MNLRLKKNLKKTTPEISKHDLYLSKFNNDFEPVASLLQFPMFSSGGHCYLQVVQHGATTRTFAIACGRRQVGYVSPPHIFYC